MAQLLKEFIELYSQDIPKDNKRFYLMNIITIAMTKIFNYKITTFSNCDSEDKSSRVTLLNSIFSFIGTVDDMPQIIDDLYEYKIKSSNQKALLLQKLGSKDSNVIKNLALVFENGNHAERSQILSYLIGTGYTYQQLFDLFGFYNVKFCSRNKLIKVADEMIKGKRRMGELVIYTRNKFLFDKESLFKMLYKFCLYKSEPSPNKTYTKENNGERVGKKVFKGELQNLTDIHFAFNKCMKEGFGDHEDTVFSHISEKDIRSIEQYRSDYREAVSRNTLNDFQDIISYSSVRNRFHEDRNFRIFEFPSQRTDLCPVCQDYKKGNCQLDHLKKKGNNLTQEELKLKKELEKIVYGGLFHVEQNENCRAYTTDSFRNIEAGKAAIMMDFKGNNILFINNYTFLLIIFLK
jgi:hypothetical protein